MQKNVVRGGGGLTRWRIEQGWQRLADTPPCVTWSLQVGEQFDGDKYGSSCTRVTSRKLRNRICLQAVFLWHYHFPFPSSTCLHWLETLALSVLQRIIYSASSAVTQQCGIHSAGTQQCDIHSTSSAGTQQCDIPAHLFLVTCWMNILDSEFGGKYRL